MADGITVRAAKPDDAERVAELLAELGYPETVEFARAKLDELARGTSDVVLVAESAGMVAGVLHLNVAELFQRAGRTARVMAIVVDEPARRRGVGRALMQGAEGRARELGCVQLELTSRPHRTAAHAFYRELGFAEGKLHFTRSLEPDR